MSHSVEKHLAVEPVSYDIEIRRFVPGYEAMQEEVLGALAEHLPSGPGPGVCPSGSARVLDLGAGTGALSARIGARFPGVRLTLLDADPAMLEQARGRLAALGLEAELRQGSFADPLPACDAAVASLSLHHVHAKPAKCDVYRNILRALTPGGILISADAAVPAAPALADPIRRRWAAHLVAHGDTEAQAFERFAQWATEDRYFGVAEELEMMREAGFEEIDVRWREGPSAVIVGRRR